MRAYYEVKTKEFPHTETIEATSPKEALIKWAENLPYNAEGSVNNVWNFNVEIKRVKKPREVKQ